MGIRSPKVTSDSCNLAVTAADGVYWGVVDNVVIVVEGVGDVGTGIDVVTDEPIPLVSEVTVIVVTILAHNDPSVRIFCGDSIPSSTGPWVLSRRVPFSE
jgi:triosephosphate isomerase